MSDESEFDQLRAVDQCRGAVAAFACLSSGCDDCLWCFDFSVSDRVSDWVECLRSCRVSNCESAAVTIGVQPDY
jgi:hypothetical protein